MSLDLVTIGETMVLFLADQQGPLNEVTTFGRHIAGAESNVAIGLARLKRTAGWISRVGTDPFGRAILFRLRGEGVDTSRVVVDPDAPTGLFVRELRHHGGPGVFYYRKGSAASRLSPRDLDTEYITSARYLLLTGITPALSPSCREAVFAAVEIARGAHVTVVLDPNIRQKLWSLEDARNTLLDLAGRCDIILPSAEEAFQLTGESEPVRAARAFLRRGPSLVVTKLGSQGAMALAADTSESLVAPAVPVTYGGDPIGAGDAFAAGFLAACLHGRQLPEALTIANRCGAAVASGRGDFESFPIYDELFSAGGLSPEVRR